MKVLDNNNWVLIESVEDKTESGLIQNDLFVAKVLSSPLNELDGLTIGYNHNAAIPFRNYFLIKMEQIYVVMDNE